MNPFEWYFMMYGAWFATGVELMLTPARFFAVYPEPVLASMVVANDG